MIDYGQFCKDKNCEHFIEWDYVFDDDCQPYPCESCKLIGQSHTVDEYPDNCPYIDEISKLAGIE